MTVHFPSLGRDTNAAIDDLSFTVNPGEIVGLVGESGAGKTVLARSLLGLPPRPGRITSGQIFFGDQDLLSLGEKEQRKRRGSEISMIVPNPRNELNPLIPVGNQIATMLQVHRGIPLKQALAGALEMLRAVQIPDPLARMQALPQELSGGMAQRIVIAMALVCRPQFIVSDDATSGLDVTVQAQILELLQKLVRENNSSMLFITRDIGIAAHFCDRVAVLYRGKIMEIAPRDAFFLRPSNPTTIMLMTAFSHNQKLRSLWAPTKAGNSHLPQSGCVYADRCPLAQEICRSQAPELRDISRGQMTRCHFPVIR
ncbi:MULTISPECIES: ABC transporter ATP-binding protein [Agrobacterium]|uniref:Nickel import system ATP-binding protein NikD n=1 Tax=Agrobacterium rubi TaxID=28099 RepID=A0AAE7R7Q8_9HYPH|nr:MULTISPECIES: ABC transporter ATP-binding protein [Agrobacterium]MBN7809211.1 ABC transporter ATP-binding protein [Agrobacterium rosae]NTE89847.1 ABC transporter ATP-binding protein [Agrobacterium rubi]NTF05303.1 ABC transporter ATP-binding protein [Agrobacterium rubi]NTF39747.1 ABC transporter ATP-binding protein [Agrobacterium rubi]QTG03408.1 ABC transporter ATP-binding protein [Agrobacterium rubi]